MKKIILGLMIVLMTLSGCKERTTVDSKVRIRTHGNAVAMNFKIVKSYSGVETPLYEDTTFRDITVKTKESYPTDEGSVKLYLEDEPFVIGGYIISGFDTTVDIDIEKDQDKTLIKTKVDTGLSDDKDTMTIEISNSGEVKMVESNGEIVE